MKPSEIKSKRIATDANTVRLLIGGRASYAFLMEAQPDDSDHPDGSKSYKSGILISKKVPASVLADIKECIRDAVKIGIAKKWGGRKPVNLQLPLNDGDAKFAEDPEKYAAYEDCFSLNAKKMERLGRPILKANGKTVETAGTIESGDWCAFDINFYPYSNRAKGVAVALNAVTLIKEGERFGGGPSTSSIEAEAEALYGELMGGGDDTAFDDVLGADDADDILAGL